MKKLYSQPQIKIKAVMLQDIISTSGSSSDEGLGPNKEARSGVRMSRQSIWD